MKNALKTLGCTLALIFVALLFGLTASKNGYLITLYSFIAGNRTTLPPDFSYNIKTIHQVFSCLYIAAFVVLAFLSGRKNYKNLFRGMAIYSALPFLGLIGYFFLKKSMKAGIIMLLTLIWGYPYFPLIITESRVAVIVAPMGIAMVASAAVLIIAHIVGKKLQ